MDFTKLLEEDEDATGLMPAGVETMMASLSRDITGVTSPVGVGSHMMGAQAPATGAYGVPAMAMPAANGVPRGSMQMLPPSMPAIGQPAMSQPAPYAHLGVPAVTAAPAVNAPAVGTPPTSVPMPTSSQGPHHPAQLSQQNAQAQALNHSQNHSLTAQQQQQQQHPAQGMHHMPLAHQNLSQSQSQSQNQEHTQPQQQQQQVRPQGQQQSATPSTSSVSAPGVPPPGRPAGSAGAPSRPSVPPLSLQDLLPKLKQHLEPAKYEQITLLSNQWSAKELNREQFMIGLRKIVGPDALRSLVAMCNVNPPPRGAPSSRNRTLHLILIPLRPASACEAGAARPRAREAFSFHFGGWGGYGPCHHGRGSFSGAL
eukprot:jgi/Mesen1/6010/ME000306S05278